MAQVGTVEVVATIDTSRYKRGARDIESANKGIEGSVDKSDSSLGKLNKRLSSMARTGLKVATTGFIALAGTITAMTIGGGISRALNIEDAQAKLKGLGHDAESVETIMNSALASVKGTAYGLDAAATIAASAVAAGVKPGKELTKYLGTTADAATIAGVSLSEMGSIFNKVQTQQKVYTQELNQLADRGIPIYQWLQDELGVTQEKLREMVAAGEVDAEVYFKAIQKNIGGAALESGKTTRGAWKNLLAAMSRIGERIVKGPIDNVRESFGTMTKWIDANADTIVDAVQGTLDTMINLGRAAVSVGKFIYDMRIPIVTVTTALITYRAIVLTTTALQHAQAAATLLMGTRYVLLNGAIVKVTLAQRLLNTVMMANPVGLIVGLLAGLGVALYAVTQQSDRTTSATSRLNEARRQAKVATDNLKLAEDNLRGSELNLEGAQISLARSRERLTQLQNSGRASALDLREAELQVKRAEEELKRAKDEVTKSTDEKNKKEQESINKAEAVKKAEKVKELSLYKTRDAVLSNYDRTNDLINSLDRLNGKSVKFNISSSIDNTEAARAAGYKSGAPFINRYAGGPVSAGRGYLVGENRDGSINDTTELFVPNQAGRIINSKELQSALGGSGGGGTEISIGNITISSEVDGERWLRRLSGNQEIVSNGLVPTQSYM